MRPNVTRVNVVCKKTTKRAKRSEATCANPISDKSLWENQVSSEFWFGLVRIRPFRSDLTISEPWDEGDRFE